MINNDRPASSADVTRSYSRGMFRRAAMTLTALTKRDTVAKRFDPTYVMIVWVVERGGRDEIRDKQRANTCIVLS
jgi:hypothetical protein